MAISLSYNHLFFTSLFINYTQVKSNLIKCTI